MVDPDDNTNKYTKKNPHLLQLKALKINQTIEEIRCKVLAKESASMKCVNKHQQQVYVKANKQFQIHAVKK